MTTLILSRPSMEVATDVQPPAAAAVERPPEAMDSARFRPRVLQMVSRVHDFIRECVGHRQTLAYLALDGPERIRFMANARVKNDMPNERRRLTRTFNMLRQAAESLLTERGGFAIATYNRAHAAYIRAEINRKRWIRYTQRGMEEELAIMQGQPPVPTAQRVPTPPIMAAQPVGMPLNPAPTRAAAAPIVVIPEFGDEPAAPEGTSPEEVCTICFERMRTFIFIPCYHLVACGTCTRGIFAADPHCPVCRAAITLVHRVYK